MENTDLHETSPDDDWNGMAAMPTTTADEEVEDDTATILIYLVRDGDNVDNRVEAVGWKVLWRIIMGIDNEVTRNLVLYHIQKFEFLICPVRHNETRSNGTSYCCDQGEAPKMARNGRTDR